MWKKIIYFFTIRLIVLSIFDCEVLECEEGDCVLKYAHLGSIHTHKKANEKK